MQITVIPADRWIRCDADSARLPEWPFSDVAIHAIQWDGSSGWIEYAGTPKPPNEPLESDAMLQPYVGALAAYLASLQVDPGPPEPVPQWGHFGELLAADAAVNAMVATAASAAPVLHLMLGVGLGQAAQGDPKTFLAAWSTALASGLAAPSLAAHVVDLGTSCDLPENFLAQLNP